MNQAYNVQIGIIRKENHDFMRQKLMKYKKMTSIVVHGIFCDTEKCRKQVLSFILEKTMPTKPGKIKTVLCGKTYYFLLIAFKYHDCSHYEVSSLFDVYFRKN